MSRLIVNLELTSWYRNRRLRALLAMMIVTLIAITAWGTAGDIAQRAAQHDATEAARAQWEGRGAANPHGMAHFGDFVFRPTGALARLDRGVQARLGKVLFLEGHRQGVPLHTDASRAGPLARFARLDAAFVLQLFVPLMLIFLGAAGFAADRQSGRLKLALVQGASARWILAGHVLVLWGLSLLLLACVLVTSIVTSMSLGVDALASPVRLAMMALTYAAFFAVVAAGIIAAVVWLRSARAALLTLLTIWVLATAVMPRAVSELTNAIYSLPSQDAFQAQMQASRADGPDGHNPEDDELDRLRQAMLEEHGVETVEALPFNFDGIAMQVDEEFGNRVWDDHFGELRSTMTRQTRLVSAIALLNPFQAIDRVSMSIAGTDLAHDLDFQQQAERYRRVLVEELNNEHAYGGSRTGDWSWEADPAFYASLPPFEYRPPGIGTALQSRAPEIIGLLLWTLFLLLVIRRGADRLERGALSC